MHDIRVKDTKYAFLAHSGVVAVVRVNSFRQRRLVATFEVDARERKVKVFQFGEEEKQLQLLSGRTFKMNCKYR